MKKIITLTLVVFAALSNGAFAQCNEFYQINEGSNWELETYNAKGKLSGRNQQHVTQYTKTGDGFNTTINSIMFNEKGKELMNGNLEMKCAGGTIYIDMRNFIPEQQLKNMGSYEMTIESENLEIPSKLTIGETLKDGSINMTATNSPLPMKMTVNITDRKVEGKESITTPAGTFDCYKISSKANFKNQMGVTMNFQFSSIEWLAPKVGIVKSESYDKNGKMNGYTILTKRN